MTAPETQQAPSIVEIRNPNMPSIYVEGLSQLMIGFPNSRMMLYSLVEPGTPGSTSSQRRHGACELILPTSAVIEIAQVLINSLVANKSALDIAKADWLKKLDAVSSSLKLIETPVMTGHVAQGQGDSSKPS